MAKLNLVCHISLVVIRPCGVSRKDGLLALPTNNRIDRSINKNLFTNNRIDRSINKNLFCFVTKMA